MPAARHPWHDVQAPANIDRLLHALMGRLTSSISPASLTLAYVDWLLHVSASPGKCYRLLEKAAHKQVRFLNYAAAVHAGRDPEPCIEPLPQDHRFDDPAWHRWPFNLIHQAFLLQQQWWYDATTGVRGMSLHHEEVVTFMARQLLDTVSPVNCLLTNPKVLDATSREYGFNLLRGQFNLFADWERNIAEKTPYGTENYEPGQQVAISPGDVVYRNRLIELIQYTPTTKDVYADPILIVPAWIMKYYILDLSPHNSLVKYLVERGHTVFMISWHNPVANDRDIGMNDYLHMGVLDALRAVQAIVPGRRVNAVGYCIGGTLLSIAAAYLAQEREETLNSVTLFAAQTDFTEAGGLMLFIDDSQLHYLEDIMWNQGYLDNRQMAGAFQLLRSNDLIWSMMVNDYLMGQRTPVSDLMAWNADATRMPFCMQCEYLRQFFLNNDLFEDRYRVDDRRISLWDIRVPIFAVATETDHVAPWHSVYKINLLEDTDVTFVLTSGGHNAGIVSEPGRKGRRYRLAHRRADQGYMDAEDWLATSEPNEGSWWPAWQQWLAERSGERVAPPPCGAPDKGYWRLGKAPGRYVFEH
jgi:polyhydroxyalkanoate synthase subunit PhaC